MNCFPSNCSFEKPPFLNTLSQFFLFLTVSHSDIYAPLELFPFHDTTFSGIYYDSILPKTLNEHCIANLIIIDLTRHNGYPRCYALQSRIPQTVTQKIFNRTMFKNFSLVSTNSILSPPFSVLLCNSHFLCFFNILPFFYHRQK